MAEQVTLELTEEPVVLEHVEEAIVLELVDAEPVELVDDEGAVQIDLGDPIQVELVVAEPEPIELEIVETAIVLEVGGEVGPRGEPGPEGPQGEPGLPGGLPAFHRHHQADPSNVWLIQHNLGFQASVSVEDSAGSVIYGDVRYLDINTVEITFAFATGGFANLS